MPNRRNFHAALTLIAILAVAGLAGAAGASAATPAQQPQRQQTAKPAQTALAQEGVIVRELDLDAKLDSLSSPAILAQVSATVKQVLVEPGEGVKKGQILAVLDNSELVLSANEARAQLAQLRATAVNAAREAARAQSLLNKGFVSKSSAEQQEASAAAAKAQEQAAQARQALAQKNLEKTQVTAPADGVVTSVTAAAGGYVRSGDTLFSMWSPDAAVLRMRAPQQYWGQVKPGQEVTLEFNGQSISTTVLRVNTALDPVSHSFEVLAQIPQSLQGVSGASLAAKLRLDSRKAVQIPISAVQMEGSQPFVFTVDAVNQVRRQDVQLAQVRAGQVEVTQGLKAGQRFVVEGAAFLSDGQKIAAQAGGEGAQ